MDEMLRRLMTHSDDEFKRQIEYILNQLKAENTKEEEASDADEDDDEEEEDADDMEDEDDEPEEDDEETLPVAGDGDFEGESLLVKSYASKDGGEEAYVPEQKAMNIITSSAITTSSSCQKHLNDQPLLEEKNPGKHESNVSPENSPPPASTTRRRQEIRWFKR